MVINTSLFADVGKHSGVEIHGIELTKIASDMGSLRSANMLVLGLSAGLLGCAKLETLEKLVVEALGEKNPALLDTNLSILTKGFQLADNRET